MTRRELMAHADRGARSFGGEGQARIGLDPRRSGADRGGASAAEVQRGPPRLQQLDDQERRGGRRDPSRKNQSMRPVALCLAFRGLRSARCQGARPTPTSFWSSGSGFPPETSGSGSGRGSWRWGSRTSLDAPLWKATSYLFPRRRPLIPCPDCGNLVSKLATLCPHLRPAAGARDPHPPGHDREGDSAARRPDDARVRAAGSSVELLWDPPAEVRQPSRGARQLHGRGHRQRIVGGVAIAVLSRTPSQPSSIAYETSLAEPTPASTITG